MHSVNIERVPHRNRHDLLSIFKLGPEKVKALLKENSLQTFRRNALKRLEDLEADFLGLPELAKIVCRAHVLLDFTSAK